MAQSKTNKNRKAKKEKFKEGAKKQAEQQRIPRTHLVPVPTWQSNETLDLRGDLLEALEQQMVIAMDSLQKCGQVLQYIMQQNIKAEKIKLQYEWNNGEKPTDKEVEDFLAQQKLLQEERKKQMLDLQEKLQAEADLAKKQSTAEANNAITGLVGPDGTPIGSSKPLVEEVTEDNDEDLEDDEDFNEEDSTDEQPSGNDDDQTSEE